MNNTDFKFEIYKSASIPKKVSTGVAIQTAVACSKQLTERLPW